MDWQRLFPNLAEWPTEKWLALPIALLFLLGIVGGIADIIFRGPF